MKGLFFKIFTWFWLATIITISATYWISSRLADNRQFPHHLDEIVEHYFDEVKEKLQEYGINKFEDWLQHNRLPRGIGVLLLDENNSIITKKRLPFPVLKHFLNHKRWPKPNGLELNVKQKWLEIDPDRKLQLFVLWLPKRPELGPPEHSPWFKQFNKRTPGWGIFRLLIALFVSGFVCYLLARHISNPIVKLRSAVGDLSKGNFDTNVAVEFNSRNDEIADLAIDFDQMATKLKEQFKRREDLIRDISHELRSPLARMRIASELIKSKIKNPNLEEITRIEAEISRLDRLIGEILDFSKLGDQAEGLTMSQFDLLGLVKEIITNANFEANVENKKIDLFKGDLKTVEIVASKNLISRAVENIIRNAVRYTFKDTKVSVNLNKQANQAIIEVIDQGPGVPNEQLKKIFEPFYRVAESRSRDSGGTGLGLAISKRAIELHNGEITAQNAKDHGLVIAIRLPLSS